MIKESLWQAEEGPRLLIELGWSDELDPATFAAITRRLRERWGIWRTVLRWHLRDDCYVAEFPLDARRVERNPVKWLTAIASSLARSAIKHDIVRYLPKQFGVTNGTPLLVDMDGRPLGRVTGD
jgi:hypothetical protein